MKETLQEAIEALPVLLQDQTRWHSLHVTYHPPEVERLWTPFQDGRLFLHRIHPCGNAEPLFHPHPWPSAVRIYSGRYRHVVGVGIGEETPLIVSREILTRGSEYELVARQAWHSVDPLGGPSDSIMVTGPLYEPPVEMPEKPSTPQQPLSPAKFSLLFRVWQSRFVESTW